MKIPTETEIIAMDDDTAENVYNQLGKEYEKRFEKKYIVPPSEPLETIREHLSHLAKYLRERSPSP